MKKLLALFLVCTMLFTSVLLFASCKKEEKVEITLSNYSLVVQKETSEEVSTHVSSLKSKLKSLTGETVNTVKDPGTETVENTDFEILVGKTGRPESAAARALIEGTGYAIVITESKIAVIGSSDMMTERAVDCFISLFENAESDTLQLAPSTVVSDVETMTVNGSTAITYSKKLDDKTGCAYGTSYRTEAENPNAYDYPVVAAGQISELIKEQLELTRLSTTQKDNTKMIGDKNEIVVGDTTRDETATVRNALDADEYGVAVVNDKLIVTAKNDVALRQGVIFAKNRMKDCLTEWEDGSKTIEIPADFTEVGTWKNNWVTDFPKPEGDDLLFSSSADVGDGAVEYYYTGSGVSTASYENYCRKLIDAGFTLVSDNTIEGSIYRTYQNAKEKYWIHVTYAAFSHKTEQCVTKFDDCAIRIVTCKNSQTRLPNVSLFSPEQTYTKITDTRITAMPLNSDKDNWGNCYIITLEDGSFIIQDGGAPKDGNDCTKLYNVLKDLFFEAHGYYPDSSRPIVIAAWYMSHGHYDHTGNFTSFAKKYGSQIELERVIANFPSDSECYNCYDPNNSTRDGISGLMSNFKGSPVYNKVQTGWKLYIRNVELEILYTHQDMHPESIAIFNDTSTVIRMTYFNTDGTGIDTAQNATTMVWLGDLFTFGSQFLRATYGNYLESDMVQVAHHGYRGCETELYKLVNPITVWWPTDLDTFYGQISESSQGSVDWCIYNVLEREEYVIISDEYNTTLTIKASGPDFANLYDAVDEKTIVFGGAVRHKVQQQDD